MGFLDNFTEWLNKTASIYSVTNTPDGLGGVTETTTLLATVKGALWQKSAVEQYLSGRVSNLSSWNFVCKPNSNFNEKNKIIIDSVTYKVSKPDNVLFEDDIMVIGLEVVQ